MGADPITSKKKCFRLPRIFGFKQSEDEEESKPAQRNDKVAKVQSDGGAPHVPVEMPHIPEDVKSLTSATLDKSMSEASSEVKDWDAGQFALVKTLQEAVRNHGRVDLMNSLKGGRLVAVKRMPTRWVRMGPDNFKETYPTASEKPWHDIGIVRLLNELKYPYVCDHMGMYRDSDNTYVVTSLATEGDLFSWCDLDPAPGKHREAKMLPIAVQIFSAIRWLHDLGIAHRDLSLENILLSNDGEGKDTVKIIDFGMATLQRTCCKQVRGKQSYQAPEMHTDEEYDTMLADNFALGVVVFAMAAQDYPWTSTKRNSCQLYEYVSAYGLRKFLAKRKLRRKGSGEHLIEVFSPSFTELVEGLVEPQPRMRTVLGESVYNPKEAKGKATARMQRNSVWEMKWLQNVRST